MTRAFILISVCLIVGCATQSKLVPYPNPSENYLEISGKIDDGIKYKVDVVYATRSSSESCKDYAWAAGFYLSQTKSFDYFPRIDSGKHHTHIPLKALSPETECNWKPSTVFLCVGPSQKEDAPSQCQSLFFLSNEKHDGNEVINFECSDSWWCFSNMRTEDVKMLNREYVVNITKKPDRISNQNWK